MTNYQQFEQTKELLQRHFDEQATFHERLLSEARPVQTTGDAWVDRYHQAFEVASGRSIPCDSKSFITLGEAKSLLKEIEGLKAKVKALEDYSAELKKLEWKIYKHGN